MGLTFRGASAKVSINGVTIQPFESIPSMSSSDQTPPWYSDWAATQRKLAADTDKRFGPAAGASYQEPEETTQPGPGTPPDDKHYPRLQATQEQRPCYVCARRVPTCLERFPGDPIPCCLMCAMDLGYEILNVMSDLFGGTPLRLVP